MTSDSAFLRSAEWPLKRFTVEELILDPYNPRTSNPRANSSDPLLRMLESEGKSCMELLKDIVSTGQINPHDFIIVTMEKGLPTVLEGNRRVTCLKIWKNPSLIPSEGPFAPLRRQVELISRSSRNSPVDKIRAMVSPNREEAGRWIKLKHQSGNSGRGVQHWTTIMKDYDQANNDPSKRSVTLAYVEFLFDNFANEKELLEKLTKSIEKYTNIERVVKRSAAQEYLGFTFSNGALTPLYENKHLYPISLQLLTDLAQPRSETGLPWSRYFNSNEQTHEYFRKHSNILPSTWGEKITSPPEQDANTSRPSGPVAKTEESKRNIPPENSPSIPGEEMPPPPQDDQTTDPQPGLFKEPTRKGKRPKAVPRYIFSNLSLDLMPERMQIFTCQISRINIDEYHEVAATAMRTLADLSMAYYAHEISLKLKGDLHIRAKTIIEHLDPLVNKKPNRAEDWNRSHHAHSFFSREHSALAQTPVHSWEHLTSPNDVDVQSKHWSEVLVAMNDHLRNTKNT